MASGAGVVSASDVTKLHLAIYDEDESIVLGLIRARPEIIYMLDDKGHSAVFHAELTQRSCLLNEFLAITRAAAVSALHRAIDAVNLSEVRCLVAMDASLVDEFAEDGNAALHRAAMTMTMTAPQAAVMIGILLGGGESAGAEGSRLAGSFAAVAGVVSEVSAGVAVPPGGNVSMPGAEA